MMMMEGRRRLSPPLGTSPKMTGRGAGKHLEPAAEAVLKKGPFARRVRERKSADGGLCRAVRLTACLFGEHLHTHDNDEWAVRKTVSQLLCWQS